MIIHIRLLQESEIQAESFCYTYDDLSIASLRIHEVAPKAQCRKEHDEDEKIGKRQLCVKAFNSYQIN